MVILKLGGVPFQGCLRTVHCTGYMTYSLNSLKGDYIGDYIWGLLLGLLRGILGVQTRAHVGACRLRVEGCARIGFRV